jgi:hypothetical protein
MNIDIVNKKNTKKSMHKLAAKNERQSFRALINMHKIKNEKHYDVYAIASKIAHGGSVSCGELDYMREYAPAILEDARKQYSKNVQSKVELCVQKSQIEVNDNRVNTF